MSWKQSLAKLKKDLKEEAKPPAPERPKPKPEAPARPIEDEDAMFLAMMGRGSRSVERRNEPLKGGTRTQEPDAFTEEMAGLKGMKRLPGLMPGMAPEPPVAPAASIAPQEAPVPAASVTPVPVASEPDAPVSGIPDDVDFESMMGGMRGMKPMKGKGIGDRPAPRPVTPVPAAPKVASPAPVEPKAEGPSAPAGRPLPPPLPARAASPSAVPETAPEAPSAPERPRPIQLAAGMAVEVDSTLDLRGHSVVDARERLLERLHDGRFLGWRTLHVQLGPDEVLADMFKDFLETLESGLIARWAVAPIPMGGAQARILYFVHVS